MTFLFPLGMLGWLYLVALSDAGWGVIGTIATIIVAHLAKWVDDEFRERRIKRGQKAIETKVDQNTVITQRTETKAEAAFDSANSFNLKFAHVLEIIAKIKEQADKRDVAALKESAKLLEDSVSGIIHSATEPPLKVQT